MSVLFFSKKLHVKKIQYNPSKLTNFNKDYSKDNEIIVKIPYITVF